MNNSDACLRSLGEENKRQMNCPEIQSFELTVTSRGGGWRSKMVRKADLREKEKINEKN